MQKLIIDADPGIGDAVVLALAILDPELDVLGVTATAGCVSGQTATRNCLAIIELLDPPKRPRLGTSDLAAPSFSECRQHGIALPSVLHGRDGLGDFGYRIAEPHNPHESAKLMIDLVRNDPFEVTLLTLGPLTNVEIACELAPDFLGLLKAMVCLGGAIQTCGDVTAAAEFNVFANPEAARMVLTQPATKTLVPLDVSSRAVLTFEQVDRIANRIPPQLKWLLHDLVPFALRAHHEHLGLEGFPLREVVALAAVARPRLFQGRMMAVDVETIGELTRGATVFDRRGVQRWRNNIEVLQSIETQGVLDYFSQILTGGPVC